MSMKKLEIIDIGARGEAIAKEDGKVIFVGEALPGEEVLAEVEQVKNGYEIATAREVLRASPQRVSPPCVYFGTCGGCQWQHIDYGYQLELKRRIVETQLRRLGKLTEVPVPPTIPSPDVWHYRNHIRFSSDREGALGFVRRHSHSFLPVDFCHIAAPPVNDLLAALQGKVTQTGHVNVRVGVQTGDLLVQPKLDVEGFDLPSGQAAYEEEVLGRRFRVSAPAFFQVNTRQAENLVRLVIERLELSGKELAVDAYCGVGLFAVLMAPQARHVIGIEESAPALRDAILNAGDIPNIEFRHGKTELVLGKLGERPEALVLDPPRTGCKRGALKAMLRVRPRRVAYVSCDPATLARDLNILVDGGYRLLEVQPIDMFPQTYHIEAVATLAWPDGEET
jgi:23S rRNA (uracil1939-C5)-methyltransferase